MSDTPAVSVRNLCKTYAGSKRGAPKEALRGISLDIPRGAFFGLLGPNGAGKSTLINILAGLTLKTGGEASICGHDIDRDPRGARLSIGVVPQELVLDTFFTVREALDIHAGYYGLRKHERRTDEIIRAMGLEDKADISSRRLSGGMRRRLLVGKALVHGPKVLVLDEPTAGVDVELREQLWDYVRTLNRAGTTILLTTHYLEEAEELCDALAIINHGEIIAQGTKEHLMAGVDSKELALRLESPIETVPAGLEGLMARVEKGQLVIKYQPSQLRFEAIMEQVHAAGLKVADLSTHEVDLEDVFRTLTRRSAA